MPGATVSFTSDFSNIINGQPKGAQKTYTGIDPSTKKELWPIPVATEQDLEDAVTAAETAFKSWSTTPIEKRKECIKAFAEAIDTHKKELAELLVKEVGKPYFNAEHEVLAAVGTYKGHLDFKLPIHVSQDDEVAKVFTQYSPFPIVGGILPWNFPIALASNKIAPAMLAGCTIILKPSPFTPYSILKLVELAQTCFPKGVVQAVGGDDNLGPLIVKHPKIPKITFTGSIATGKKIQEAAAKQLKRVTLELGGNDPSIICEDVNIEEVAGKVAAGAFYNTGQICVAIKRIFVHSSIYEPFLSALATATKGLQSKNFMGPIQNSMQFEKVSSIYSDCKDNKYTFALGDSSIPESNGYFAPPAIVDNPPSSSRIWKEEPFGPIVPTQPWDDEEDVIRRANDTNAGLGSSVFSKDRERALRIAGKLEAGTVWINSGARFTPTGYFAGMKESGLGGEGGELGLAQYMQAQTIYEFK